LQKKFVVAVDGSKMSIRGLQLAAFLMQPNLDTVTIITIGKKNTGAEWMDVDPSTDLEKSLLSGKLTPEQLLGAAKGELLRCGVRPSKVDMEVVDMETDPAEAIIKYTSGLRRGAGVLVLGASGKGMSIREGYGLPMGRTAEAVLQACKCPILMVRNREIAEDLSVRNPPRPSMTIVMCADRSHTCRAAFDAAYHLCRAGDRLFVVQVKTDNILLSSTTYWQDECTKLAMLRQDITIEFRSLPKQKTVTDTIVTFCADEEAHVVVMGSIELTRPPDANGPRVSIGSVAQAIAKRTTAHSLIVKNFSLL